jgi:hypothetical protein
MAKAIERADFYQIGTLFLCCNHYTAKFMICQGGCEKYFCNFCRNRFTAK